jgi:hypothetical protein
VIVVLQGCVIVVLQGCVIVLLCARLRDCYFGRLQGCVIVARVARLRDCAMLMRLKIKINKSENHFSPYPRSEGDINLYTRLKVAMSC